MQIIKTTKSLQQWLESQALNIGFVPTMGALHAGHISLVEKAKSENDLVVCSIFVNPTQFNDPKDFEKYPITLEADIEKLVAADTDVLFLPSVEEMYPNGLEQVKQYEIGFLNSVLDGEFRPGHFNGVCVIVHKLLLAVRPNRLYLGEKDFQQCLVIKQMVAQEHLALEVITCPTLREMNGLAMSSRNARLSAKGKEDASLVYWCLNIIKEEQANESFEHLKIICEAKLSELGFKTEYLQLANADTLEPLHAFDFNKKMVVLIASHFEGVRLIDNLRIN